MDKRKSRKKKILIAILATITVAAIGIGTTLAYLYDKDIEENTFTIGNISIDIDEPTWDDETDGKDLTPGDTEIKDPTVTAVDGESYMRIKMEIIDTETNTVITDEERVEKILSTLYYDKDYTYNSETKKGTTPNLSESSGYTSTQLDALKTNNKIISEYNTAQFEYDDTRVVTSQNGAGGETTYYGIRYYNYIGTDGKFTKDTVAVLFTNAIIPSDWSWTDIYTLKGANYTVDRTTNTITVSDEGSNYKIVLTAQAIQYDNVADADAAWSALDAAEQNGTLVHIESSN